VEYWTMDCNGLIQLHITQVIDDISRKAVRLYYFKHDIIEKYNIIALGNSVPAAAGIQREQALIILTGCKGYVDGYYLIRLECYLLRSKGRVF